MSALFYDKHGKTLPDGSIVVQNTTNGNADLPTPGPVEYFIHHFTNPRDAYQYMSYSGEGGYGGKITATLDGVPITKENYRG